MIANCCTLLVGLRLIVTQGFQYTFLRCLCRAVRCGSPGRWFAFSPNGCQVFSGKLGIQQTRMNSDSPGVN
jgi:hypothetical protein